MKIHVNYEADVPAGEYCEYCSHQIKTKYKYKCFCGVFDQLLLTHYITLKHLKCPECIKACKESVNNEQ